MTVATKEFGYLLAGEWRTGVAESIRSPFDGAEVATVHRAGRAEAEQALQAAAAAFEHTRAMPAFERQRVLRTVAQQLTSQREDFARMIALEAGKPLKAARAEVDRAILTFQVAAEEATRITGDYLPLDVHESAAGRWGMVRRFPLGVVTAITPFNFPLNLVAHKLAPAIAAGCTVVLKPAPQTPATALMLAELIASAGWPAGALNVLPLSNEDAAPIIESDIPKLLSFTGSVPVGWSLKARSGKKNVVLELGGNAGVIIHSDADLRFAAERCVTGGFAYAGQSCISVQRIYVHRSLFAEFRDTLVEGARKLRVGAPLDEQTDVGPLIRLSDAERVERWIAEAVQSGATLLTGGKRNRSVVEPAVLTGTTPDMKVNCKEIFGPVVTVEPYDDFDSAVAAVNHSSFGLQAGVFTNDFRLIQRAFERLEVGGLMVNDVPTFRVDPMPYGGVKDSGLGREGVRYAIEAMTEPKLLVVNGGK